MQGLFKGGKTPYSIDLLYKNLTFTKAFLYGNAIMYMLPRKTFD